MSADPDIRAIPRASLEPQIAAPTDTELDERHPWLGLEPYTEADRPYFAGRSDEVEELYRLIRRERVTLLFGESGVGKTSLIRAGIFPVQRAGEALPVYVRLEYSNEAPALANQVKQAIAAAAAEASMERPEPRDDETLWEYLHLADGQIWSEHHRLVMPFLVFDDFEEIFTLGQTNRPADVRSFLSQFSDLAEERVPVEVQLRVDQYRDKAALYNLERHHYKILLSVREDFLAQLDELRGELPPTLFHNRMQLLPFSLGQAKDVLRATGATLGVEEVAGDLVQMAASDQTAVSRGDEVSPTILSILCKALNDERIRSGAGQILRPHLEAVRERFKGDVLVSHYRQRIDRIPKGGMRGWWPFGRTRRLNDYLSDQFVEKGYRVPHSEEEVRAELGGETVDELLGEGVLGRRSSGKLELRHDVLPPALSTTGHMLLEELVKWLWRGLKIATVVAGVASIIVAYLLTRPDEQTSLVQIYADVDTPDEAELVGYDVIGDLNNGTQRIRAAVDDLAAHRFLSASADLSDLRRDLDRRQEFYCFVYSDYRYLNTVLRNACDAIGEQAIQAATLAGLSSGGLDGLSAPGVRQQTTGRWEDSENAFEEYRRVINGIVNCWAQDLEGDC